MTFTFTIPGELTDLNTYIRAERSNSLWAAKLKKEETERVAWDAKAARLPKITDYPVYLTYTWFTPNKRKDLDNICFGQKFIQDGLVQAGVLEGDGQRYVVGFQHRFAVDPERPRVEVYIVY